MRNMPRYYFPIVVLLLILLAACNAEPEERGEEPIPASPAPLPSPTLAPPAPGPTAEISATPTGAAAQEDAAEEGPPDGEGGITLEEDRLIPELPPTQVQGSLVENEVHLSWLGTGSDRITAYLVYRRPAGATEWELIKEVPVTDENEGAFMVQIALEDLSTVYEYSVSALDLYGKESERSDLVRVPHSQ